MPQLVPLSSIERAEYNPREADAQRLEALKMSLRKLGFILPLYTTTGGHLLSGHQRSTAAMMLGCNHVPVESVDLDEKFTRNVNLVFNRATNDMRADDDSNELWGKLGLENVVRLADAVPDRDPDTEAFYRCMNPVMVPVADVVGQVDIPYEAQPVAMCEKLLSRGIVMPVVMTKSGRIVNGKYRAIAAAERSGRSKYRKHKLTEYPVVFIEDEEGELSDALLNLISMRFTMQNQYADQLRFGAFRRAQTIVPGLLPAYRFLADNWVLKPSHASMAKKEDFWHRFRKNYGESICDLGAGQRRTRPYMEKRGIFISDWEPYPLDWRDPKECPEDDTPENRPSLGLARKLTERFLSDIESGVQYSTVALPAVLNSVPFRWDRMCLLAMAHSLCGVKTQLVGTARAVEAKDLNRSINRVDPETGNVKAAQTLFPLDYEPGIILGDINVMPKVQKLHSLTELEADLRVFFEEVRVKNFSASHAFRAACPKRVSLPVLKAAIMHEFDLPYDGGRSLGMAERALAAFGKRLRVDFTKIKAVEKPEN
ncbi:ParB N-terminal domain-containing protein [Paracoccus sp. MKU1]|uniref:ParB N-terminal domain-containing protein n=1 Tax=Paracoccus sp. MKU1 TaxID=1745182 RepID=UPI000726D89B|nr:ParB N-terminal domain-containing protein [Paracoccus sp. MKU1]KRW94283.1 hypothetical protein AQY21_20345 [Paracoccus sp. MKU1]